MCVYIYIYIYICMYVYIYIYIYTHTARRGWRTCTSSSAGAPPRTSFSYTWLNNIIIIIISSIHNTIIVIIIISIGTIVIFVITTYLAGVGQRPESRRRPRRPVLNWLGQAGIVHIGFGQRVLTVVCEIREKYILGRRCNANMCSCTIIQYTNLNYNILYYLVNTH